MKRKAETLNGTHSANKKPATAANGLSQQDIKDHFRADLFDPKTLANYTSDYANSTPYKHAVTTNLISDPLLRSVRREITQNIHFTPKETDIYKIHQSGDLANLSGLDASALEKLPSLLTLRDALYSPEFRGWISGVAGSGPLSGTKTDMAVNVYAPGCHLLCHDDVIGTRRVSYILYLTDPDVPWREEWGGALRLYPVDEMKDESGKAFKIPRAEWSKSIPPQWNQLSFFAVQPGESFHDVEEVYKRAEGESGEDGGRVRMAISGWFHIPQEGEEGFEPGLEEKLAEKSSLQQLQGKADQFDLPRPVWTDPEEAQSSRSNGKDAVKGGGGDDGEEEGELSEQDLQFLLQFMTPNYLTPDTVEELNDLFTEESTVQLANFLSKKFAPKLREQLETRKPSNDWKTSRPPFKHRYQYIQPSTNAPADPESDPLRSVIDTLLPSLAFRKWLSLVTGLTLSKSSVLARRFRRGLDYQLATGYESKDAQIEYTLCVTPSKGWGGGDEEEEEAAEQDGADAANGNANGNGNGEETNGANDANGSKNTSSASDKLAAARRALEAQKNAGAVAAPGVAEKEEEEEEAEEDNVGGYELYMAGDDDDNNDEADSDADSDLEIPAAAKPGNQKANSSATGAGNRRSAGQKKKPKADPAVYQAAKDGDEEDDDGVLFSNPAGWNTLSIVLRDRGTLKFVKYVSAAAKGDRWDFVGCVGVVDDGSEDGDEDEDEDEDEADEGADSVPIEAGGEEDEEFEGFGE